MRRALIVLLGAIVAAALIGTLMAEDPGYVLISYSGATLQTGLWVFLGGLFLLGFAILLLLRFWRGLYGTAEKLQRWRLDRSIRRSIEHTSKGLILLQEGHPERAEKYLLSGVDHQPKPAVNYLHLAKAASRRGNAKQREKYFRLAEEADKKAHLAISMMRAELAIERRDYAEGLKVLANVPENDTTVLMQKSAVQGLGDVQALEKLLPRLKKVLSETEYLQLETSVVVAGITSQEATEDQRIAQYRSASEPTKNDVRVLLALSGQVNQVKELESILRKIIKQSWQPELIEAYAQLGPDLLQKRLKTAVGWQKQRPVDPSLNYCVGFLQEALGERDSAMTAYQTAVDQGGHKLASEQLARLYASDGNHQKSNELLSLAYRGA